MTTTVLLPVQTEILEVFSSLKGEDTTSSEKKTQELALVTIPSLEKKFKKELLTINVDDLKKPNDFDSYLKPNETHPQDVARHLSMNAPGIIVSTGTERSFFDICLGDEKTTGLVVVDINPKVKAYVDFNVLLMRLTKNREDYVQIATNKPKDLEQRIIENQEIPEDLKEYYLRHLQIFSVIFYSIGRDWIQKESYLPANYYKNNTIFNKLKKMATSGNIIAKVGSIHDLTFLQDEKIGIIDISNIPDYVCLDFKINTVVEKIIYTNCQIKPPIYASEEDIIVSPEEHKQIETLLKEMMETCGSYQNYKKMQEKLKLAYGKGEGCSKMFPLFYSPKLLKALQAYKENYLVQAPNGTWINCNPTQQEYEMSLPNHLIYFFKYPEKFSEENGISLKEFVAKHREEKAINSCLASLQESSKGSNITFGYNLKDYFTC